MIHDDIITRLTDDSLIVRLDAIRKVGRRDRVNWSYKEDCTQDKMTSTALVYWGGTQDKMTSTALVYWGGTQDKMMSTALVYWGGGGGGGGGALRTK